MLGLLTQSINGWMIVAFSVKLLFYIIFLTLRIKPEAWHMASKGFATELNPNSSIAAADWLVSYSWSLLYPFFVLFFWTVM